MFFYYFNYFDHTASMDMGLGFSMIYCLAGIATCSNFERLHACLALQSPTKHLLKTWLTLFNIGSDTLFFTLSPKMVDFLNEYARTIQMFQHPCNSLYLGGANPAKPLR